MNSSPQAACVPVPLGVLGPFGERLGDPDQVRLLRCWGSFLLRFQHLLLSMGFSSGNWLGHREWAGLGGGGCPPHPHHASLILVGCRARAVPYCLPPPSSSSDRCPSLPVRAVWGAVPSTCPPVCCQSLLWAPCGRWRGTATPIPLYFVDFLLPPGSLVPPQHPVISHSLTSQQFWWPLTCRFLTTVSTRYPGTQLVWSLLWTSPPPAPPTPAGACWLGSATAVGRAPLCRSLSFPAGVRCT